MLSAAQERSLLSLTGFESKSFLLLWRGTRDGFKVSTFHKLCDGKANILTLIKSAHGHIFGGYASMPWLSTAGWGYDSSAFIFSPKNSSNIALKIADYKTGDRAVFHSSYCGPSFGDNHLDIRDLSDTNKESYSKLKEFKLPYGRKLVEKKSANSFMVVQMIIFKQMKLKYFN